MLKTGILNPAILRLLARIRHTNALVLADRGFPFWPEIETVDLTLTDDIPTVLDVLAAIRSNFEIGEAHMAEEFFRENPPPVRERYGEAIKGCKLLIEPHVQLKKRVPTAIGLIRTADTIPYSNMILVSA